MSTFTNKVRENARRDLLSARASVYLRDWLVSGVTAFPTYIALLESMCDTNYVPTLRINDTDDATWAGKIVALRAYLRQQGHRVHPETLPLDLDI